MHFPLWKKMAEELQHLLLPQKITEVKVEHLPVGMVQANVGQKRLKSYILRRFFHRSYANLISLKRCMM